MARERASKHRAVVNWLNPTPPRYRHDPPNILSLNQALQLAERVRDAGSKRLRKKKATPRQTQRDCHRCGKKGHAANDTAEDGSFKCPTRITEAQTTLTELSHLRAEFSAELAAIRQKDEEPKLLRQQQHRNQQDQQNLYQPQLHYYTLDAYTTTLQKHNRTLPIWSTNYFALYRALQHRSELAHFVHYSGKSHFVKLYIEGVRKYVDEKREKEGRKVMWPNVQVVVGGRGVGR